MDKQNPNKIKLLKLWEILSSDTDEDNPLSTNELISRLKEHGIECDRRTLYNDIDTLNSYGYEIMGELRDRANRYFVSVRGFDVPELKILMDAVTAANFISVKKTKQLHNKIAALAGNNRAELLKKSQSAEFPIKSENEGVYYTVSQLDEAILQGKKVSFQYFEYDIKGERRYKHNGERYVVSPLTTVISQDRYYLIGFYDGRDAYSHYRIDKITNVKIESADILTPNWVCPASLAEHKKQLFSMYSGETVRATFVADNSLINVVFDKFGHHTKLRDLQNGCFTFSVNVQLSPTFFGWCLGFGDKLVLTAPIEAANMIKTRISEYKG